MFLTLLKTRTQQVRNVVWGQFDILFQQKINCGHTLSSESSSTKMKCPLHNYDLYKNQIHCIHCIMLIVSAACSPLDVPICVRSQTEQSKTMELLMLFSKTKQSASRYGSDECPFR